MKSILKRLSLGAAVLTVAAVLIPSVQGSEFDLKTFISVNQPFQVPGAVLEPNTKYVFKRMDANSGTNHVVQVFNEDQSKLITTFFGISDVRLEPADETILTFMETAPGYPKPVQSWFYPGRTIGLEFIYSKAQRLEIAAHAPGSETTVQTAETFVPEPSTEEVMVDETRDIQQTVIEPLREKPSETLTEEPVTAPVESTEAEAPVTEDTAETTPAEEKLPETAGELPLIGLLGLACLGLRHTLRRQR